MAKKTEKPPESPPRRSLVAIHSEYRATVQEVLEIGFSGDESANKRYEEILDELCKKADGYGVVEDQLKSEAAFWKQQKDECAKSERVASNALDRLKERLKYVLNATPGKFVQGDIHRYALSKTKDKIEINIEKLPGAYKRIETSVVADRAKIEADLKKEIEITGVVSHETYALRRGRPK